MRIAVSGSSGLIGNRLTTMLRDAGCTVERLIRKPPEAGSTDIPWNPARGLLDGAALEGVDVVVHLAGENIAAGRWSAKRKEAIFQSRVNGTRLLGETVARLEKPPRVIVCASAVGYYGDRGSESLSETSTRGEGFVADVCEAWEAAAEPARQSGIRVVNLRIGIVLSSLGGALARMLTPFKRGMGGVIGHGRQYMSWIVLDDLVRVIQYVLLTDDISGPVNAVTPNPVTNHEFTKTLGRVLRRPTVAPLPGFMVRLLFGEMGQELLLASARVTPNRLQESGFVFLHPDLEDALRTELGARQHAP
jgi:uncharacterized protein (TIGR01777 family)